MGCDIHIFAEYFKDGKWNPADPWSNEPRYGETQWRVPNHLRVEDGRNYNWFAWLADVRNGTWGENITPLSGPRGLPDDCCERVREDSERWGCDGHSHSYFTFKELEEGWQRAKDQKVTFHGHMNPDMDNPEFQKWKALPEDERGEPKWGYCASGTNCVPFTWHQTLESMIGLTYHRVIDYLWNAKFEYCVKDDEVRIVFWFDN